MILIAILCPGLSFLLRGKIISAIIAILLQIVAVFTFLIFGAGVILWGILAVWSVLSYNDAKNKKRHKQTLRAMRAQS